MSDTICPFCKSTTIVVETPYVDRVTGKKKTTYCCNAQKQNAKYRKSRYSPYYGEAPPQEEVSKL